MSLGSLFGGSSTNPNFVLPAGTSLKDLLNPTNTAGVISPFPNVPGTTIDPNGDNPFLHEAFAQVRPGGGMGPSNAPWGGANMPSPFASTEGTNILAPLFEAAQGPSSIFSGTPLTAADIAGASGFHSGDLSTLTPTAGVGAGGLVAPSAAPVPTDTSAAPVPTDTSAAPVPTDTSAAPTSTPSAPVDTAASAAAPTAAPATTSQFAPAPGTLTAAAAATPAASVFGADALAGTQLGNILNAGASQSPEVAGGMPNTNINYMLSQQPDYFWQGVNPSNLGMGRTFQAGGGVGDGPDANAVMAAMQQGGPGAPPPMSDISARISSMPITPQYGASPYGMPGMMPQMQMPQMPMAAPTGLPGRQDGGALPTGEDRPGMARGGRMMAQSHLGRLGSQGNPIAQMLVALNPRLGNQPIP